MWIWMWVGGLAPHRRLSTDTILDSTPTTWHGIMHHHQLLAYQDEDGQTIEPEFYVPVIPTVLLNGSDGGWVGV